MNTDTALILQCFETLAEKGTDITAAVYSHYTSSNPEVMMHIGYIDESMKGRMLEQLYRLLLKEVDQHYLSFEVRTHADYGATTPLYGGLLNAVMHTVRALLGKEWTEVVEKAWTFRVKEILDDIQSIENEILKEKQKESA